jgi:hypothetical protein
METVGATATPRVAGGAQTAMHPEVAAEIRCQDLKILNMRPSVFCSTPPEGVVRLM